MIYGYARVSTSEQETTLQIDALNRAGAQTIYQEKTSSVGKRPELRRLLATLTKNDCFVVYKLDRLARSLKDLLGIIEQLEAIGCGFRSLTEPIDTTNPAGRLMLNILGSVAEFERSLIRERTVAGQVAAIKRGAVIGRPRALSPDQEIKVLSDWRTGAFTQADLYRKYNVHEGAVRRVIYTADRPNHRFVTPNRPIIGPLLCPVK